MDEPEGTRSPWAVGVLLAGSPFMAMIFAALGPILPLLATHYGGPFGAQMIMTMPALGIVFGGLVAGLSVEHFGARPVLILGLLVYGIAGSTGLYFDQLVPLLVARFLVGMAMAHASTAIGVLVGSWFTGLRRARFLGYQAGVAGVSALTFLVLSGLLAERIGWRAPFALYLLAVLIAGIAVLAIRRDATPAPVRGERPPLRAVAALWRIYALGIFLFVGYFMTSIQLSFLLAADGVDSPLQRSLVIAGGVLAGGLCGASYGPVLARIGPVRTQLLLACMLGGGIVVIGLSDSIAWTAFGAILAGGGGGMAPPHIENLLLANAPAQVRARAVSLMFAALYIADFLNPLIVTPLRAVLGIHESFLIVGSGIIAVAFGLAARGGRTDSRRLTPQHY